MARDIYAGLHGAGCNNYLLWSVLDAAAPHVGILEILYQGLVKLVAEVLHAAAGVRAAHGCWKQPSAKILVHCGFCELLGVWHADQPRAPAAACGQLGAHLALLLGSTTGSLKSGSLPLGLVYTRT